MGTAPHRPMTQTDFMSWRLDIDPVLRSTIVAVVLLDRSPDPDRVDATMRRAIRRIPLFRCRVVPDRYGMSPPHWEEDPDFDPSWHVRRFTLPGAADWAGVLDVARTAAMTAFDKDRPLWEFTVLDGLDGGRAALVMKVHHSLTDGVGGMQMIDRIVDRTRDGGTPDDPSEPGERGAGDDSDGILLAGARSILRASTSVLRDPVGALRGTVALAGSALRLIRPVTTTLSPVMTERSTRRTLTTLDVPLPALREAATVAGGSLNDAYLAAVLLGAARYHEAHAARLPQLRVTLPINMRTEDDEIGGNRITLARFALPTDLADPPALIRRIHDIVDSWRREPAVPLSPVLAGAVNLLPPSALAGMLTHVDLVASNVTGSAVPLYLAGAQMLANYAFSPTLGSAFNVTLLSYTDHCSVGLNIDAAAVPDADVLAAAVADGFRDVLALCSATTDTAVRS